MTSIWTPEERSARMLFRFDDGSFYEQRVVEQSLDPRKADSPKFYLYYFVKDQTYDNKEKPTILFAAGGPGQKILPHTAHHLHKYGHSTAYFHLRGAGVRQLPGNAGPDRHISTAST